MTVLKRNIAANFAGGVWTGLMGLVFVPLYIHFLGIEAYGLVSIFATMLGFFALLDMGLSITLNREMARLIVRADENAQEMRDLLRTLEVPYWLLAAVVALVVPIVAPFIAYHWVNVEKIAPRTVQTAITLMGLAAAIQLPTGFYSGGLLGLQRQGLANAVTAVMASVRGLGAVFILWLVSPTVEAFFTWQIAVSALQVGAFVLILWRSLPRSASAPRFRRELLAGVGSFAASMTGIMVTSTLLTQLDKVILVRVLSLSAFGYYALANVVAMSLYRFIQPVFTATFPRMTNLVELGATEELAGLYHKSAQLAAVLLLPVAATLALFSREVLLVWTQNPTTAERTHVLLSLLVSGIALHGLAHIPYALQLAHGWTRLNLIINTALTILLVPLMIVLATRYGALGAASVWLILFVGYLVASTSVMHRRLLTAERGAWLRRDVARPFLAVAAVTVVGRLVVGSDWPAPALIVSVSFVGAGALAAAALAADRLDVRSKSMAILTALRTRAIGRG